MTSPTDVVPDETESVSDTAEKGFIVYTGVGAGRTATLAGFLAACLEASRPARLSTRDDYIAQLGWPETVEPVSAAELADTSGSGFLSQLSENIRLRHENALLQRGLSEIKQRLARIEAALPEVKVVVLREISRSEAKKEIKELFAHGDALDYEDIVDKLSLDLKLVVDICDELIAEGEIAPDARPHTTG